MIVGSGISPERAKWGQRFEGRMFTRQWGKREGTRVLMGVSKVVGTQIGGKAWVIGILKALGWADTITLKSCMGTLFTN